MKKLIFFLLLFSLVVFLLFTSGFEHGDTKDLYINLAVEIIGIIGVVFFVDYFLSRERYEKLKKINKVDSEGIKLLIEKTIIRILRHFRYIKKGELSIDNFDNADILLRKFLDEKFDETYRERIAVFDKKNIRFLNKLIEIIKEETKSISKELKGVKPYCKPEIMWEVRYKIIETLGFLNAMVMVEKSFYENVSKIVDKEETEGGERVMKFMYDNILNSQKFKYRLHSFFNFLIFLHKLAKKNELFYSIE